MPLPTWPVASGSLVLGFAVAQATGVRPLGGIVLLVGAGWCAWQWRRRGYGRTTLLLAAYAACFALSHMIADTLGTWGAVFAVSAAMGALTWAVADASSSGPGRADADGEPAVA